MCLLARKGPARLARNRKAERAFTAGREGKCGERQRSWGKHRLRSTVNSSDQVIVFRQDVAHLVLKQGRSTFLLF